MRYKDNILQMYLRRYIAELPKRAHGNRVHVELSEIEPHFVYYYEKEFSFFIYKNKLYEQVMLGASYICY